ncbi:MAG: hypothetical protein J6X84_01525 [Treponema sp.]|nr:hypothetical protein [Treponema sp.]
MEDRETGWSEGETSPSWRVFTQDQGQAALRTIYDGFSFDVVKQSQTFANGQFVDSYETGIRWDV